MSLMPGLGPLKTAPPPVKHEVKVTKTYDVKPKPPAKLSFLATAYTAECEGCIGVTRYGFDVRNTIYSPSGLRVIAVDPAVIKPLSIVRVELPNGHSFKAIAGDTGGAINGRHIDVLVSSNDTAMTFGRQDVKIQIMRKGAN